MVPLKRVFALVTEDDGQNYPQTFDAIEYRGRWWLVPSYLEGPPGMPRRPALLIPLDAFETSEFPQPSPHQLLLGWSVSRSELDGRKAPGRCDLSDVVWSPDDCLIEWRH